MSTSTSTNQQNGDGVPQVIEDTADFDSLVLTHPTTLHFQQQSPNIRSSRSTLNIKPEHQPYSLLGTTLRGPDTITEPYVFVDEASGSLLAFYRLGCRLAGHAGIVHGGIPAMILDECMGRACFPLLPEKIAVTAKLELDYKAPIPVDSVIIVQVETKQVEGRKASVEARIQAVDSDRDLVKAKGLFIQPKWAGEMSQVM